MIQVQLQREISVRHNCLNGSSDEIVKSLHSFMSLYPVPCEAKSSVFSKQSVIDELILCGFASEQAGEGIMSPSQKTQYKFE